DKYKAIEDLFLPENIQGKFAMFQSVRFTPNKPVTFNIHLNPCVNGRDKALSTVTEALDRLGLSSGVKALAPLIARGNKLDNVFYFCLDVGEASDNRVKIYTYHQDATIKDITRICRVAKSYVPDEHE